MARLAPDYVAGLLAEYEEVGHLIRSPVPDAAGVDALRRGIAGLHRLIFAEEQDLFPYALQTLSRDQWDAVDEAQAAGYAAETR